MHLQAPSERFSAWAWAQGTPTMKHHGLPSLNLFVIGRIIHNQNYII